MKRLFSLLLILTLLLSLAACGGKDGAKAPQTPEDGTPQSPQSGAAAEKLPEASPDPLPEQTPEAETPFAVTPLSIRKGSRYCDVWDEEYHMLCSATWEELALSDDTTPLAAELQALNARQAAYGDRFVADWEADAREALANAPDYFGGMTSSSTYRIQRADSLILSIREDCDAYTGGVHPNYGVLGLNFDTATGAPLSLEEVLTDTDGLTALLTQQLREKYPLEPFIDLEETLSEYTPEDYTWTLGYQGITFYFSPYEIAAYASGLLTVTLWFDGLPELFREEYTVAPEAGYAVELPAWSEIDVDLTAGDARRDTLSFWAPENEYGSRELTICVNGVEYTDTSWSAYYITPYLVCVDSGESARFFLYAEGSSDNDYRTVYIYDLNGGEPRLIADHPGAGFMSRWDTEDGIYYTDVFTDLSALVLGSRCNLLGTKTALRTYCVAQDGTISPLSDHFTLDSDLPSITSVLPLEVTLLPQNTEQILPAGTEFFFLRTDNETTVDLITAQGQECRIVIEEIDWTPTIDGIPEWECFEDLMYAG